MALVVGLLVPKTAGYSTGSSAGVGVVGADGIVASGSNSSSVGSSLAAVPRGEIEELDGGCVGNNVGTAANPAFESAFVVEGNAE